MVSTRTVRRHAIAPSRATLILCTLAIIACGGQKTDATPADPDAALMERGVSLLYQSADPIGAETAFREVLQRNPSHYGAQYQLAVALDRGGRPGEARTRWQSVLDNAERIQDTATARTARARLAAPDTASEAAMMALGLDLLYRQKDPTAAAAQFRDVLRRNPTHYGATYQLATALDQSGQERQARALWEKVLGMASTYRDTATARTARRRLETGR